MDDREPVSPERDLRPEVLGAVRVGVRRVLEDTPEFRAASPETRRALAQRMVKVASVGAKLLETDRRLTAEVAGHSAPMATAQEAPRPALDATGRAANAVRDLQAAIDFPTYVQSLISGVFQAITRSNLQQLESIADMLDHVAQSSEAFTDSTVADGAARQWVVGKVPGVSLVDGQLTMADDVELNPARLREVLDASESEVSAIDPSDLDGTLVPLARRRMGRDRQALLATMVQMGLQRIVVDEGSLTAQMEMRVDARSVQQNLQRQREEIGVNAGASASFGMGAWGASAHVDTTFSKVSAEDNQRTDDLGLRAQLYSHVQLAFRTEQVPLDRMADQRARVKISQHARVPDWSNAGSTTATPPTALPTSDLKVTNFPTTPTTAPTPPNLQQTATNAANRVTNPTGNTGGATNAATNNNTRTPANNATNNNAQPPANNAANNNAQPPPNNAASNNNAQPPPNNAATNNNAQPPPNHAPGARTPSPQPPAPPAPRT